MTYEKQGFYSGQPLKASQLDLLEDGIILAQSTAQEAQEIAQAAAENAVAANMEKGTGTSATQQVPDKVANGFVFENNPNAANYDGTLAETIPYGATGNFSSAFGGKTSAQGKRAHAEGSGTVAKGGNAHSEGSGTAALGGSSHAEGYATTAVGVASHAEGGTTQALAQNAHAEGLKTIAAGEHSHAEGEEPISRGTGSHAEGYKAEANGNYSHAEGEEAVAIGVAAHAEGYKARANGDYSHAGGYCTITNKVAQHVIGKYNVGKSNTVFEIGNGESEDNRSNALEVYENGDIGINYGGEMYSFFHMFADFLTDKYKSDFVSGEYAAKIIVDNMNSASAVPADIITKKSYPAGTTISFRYYINSDSTLKDGTWVAVCRTNSPDHTSIYENHVGQIPITKGQWLTYECTLPEDGYIYFGAEVGQWGAQASITGTGYILIDNFTVTNDDISITDTFNDGLNSTLFNINNRNAVVLGEGYQK